MWEASDPRSWGNKSERIILNDFADTSYDVWEEEFRNDMELKGFRIVSEGEKKTPENNRDAMMVMSHLLLCISDFSLDVISYGQGELMWSKPSIALHRLRKLFSEENKECRSLNPPKRRWCEDCKSRLHSTGRCNEVSDSEDEEVLEYPMAMLKSVGKEVSNDTVTAVVVQEAQALILSTDAAISECSEVNVTLQKIECSNRDQHHRKMGILSVNDKSVGNVSNVANFTGSDIVISIDDTDHLVTKGDGEEVKCDIVHENVMELVSCNNAVSVLCNIETENLPIGVLEAAVFTEQQLPRDVLYIEDNNTTKCLHKCATEDLENVSNGDLCRTARINSQSGELNINSVYCEHSLQGKQLADGSKLAGVYCNEGEKLPMAVFNSVNGNVVHKEACNVLYMTKFGIEVYENSDFGAEISVTPEKVVVDGAGVDCIVLIQVGKVLLLGIKQKSINDLATRPEEFAFSIPETREDICLEYLKSRKRRIKHKCKKWKLWDKKRCRERIKGRDVIIRKMREWLVNS